MCSLGVLGKMSFLVLGAEPWECGWTGVCSGGWVYRKEELRVFNQDLLRPLGLGQRVRNAHSRRSDIELDWRLGHSIWRRGRGVKI